MTPRDGPAPLQPPARIVRRTASQRAYEPEVERAAGALERWARPGALARGPGRGELDARLRAVAATLTHSAWYRETLQAAGLAPGDLQRLEDLRHFPVLERRTLVDRGAELLALPPDDPRAGELVLVRSSGSTGEPVAVPRTRLDLLHMWAVLRFFLSRLQVALPRRPRVVLLCPLPGGLEYSVRLPLLAGGALHRLSLQRPRALERLRRARPAVLFSDPEGLHWLAAQAEAPRPLLILTSASHFGPAQRAELARTQPAPVLNYYATTETGPIAWECLEAPGRFHVLLPDVWVESLEGRLLVTRLRPGAWPLLRYRTGDAGLVVEGACRCGFEGPSLESFEGRRACLFCRPDGTAVDAWQLAWLFKQHPLRSFGLVQTGFERFRLELEPDQAAAAAGLAPTLESALRRLGWATARVEAGALAGGRAAKPEPFRCEFPPPSGPHVS